MKYIFCILILAITSQLSAQSPPEACARLLIGLGQDSVTWQATPCAGFGGYVILGRENNTGAFAPLDTVTTFNYVHPNPSENVWDYQVGMICNGVLTNISQTVSNQRPITPDLRSVNIVGTTPTVSWDPSPNPEVIGYQLYKENPYGSGNYFPYPTPNSIVSGLTYSDNGATDLLARYAIIAVSECNKSLLGIGSALDGTTGPHTSIVLAGEVDTCQQEISLTWNGYENWADGVENYEVWVQRNGAAPTKIATLNNTARSYLYTNAQDNDVLLFYIRAIERNKNNYAQTNTLRFDVRVNRPMDFIYLTSLTVNNSNEVEIQWRWDTDTDFASGDLLRGTDATNLTSRLPLLAVGSGQNAFTDTDVLPKEQEYYYKVGTTDACGLTAESNIGRTILLKVKALDNFQNEVSWNPAYMEYGEVISYEVYKEGSRVATLGPTDSMYIDVLDVADEGEVFRCYRVIANMKISYPDGTFSFFENQSNQDCATQGSDIYLPNALSPNGENTFFRPVIVFGRSINSYNMKIYDRYGAQIFESNDLYDAWDGTKDGQAIPQGVYVYVIRYQAANGKWFDRKGTVMLVR